MAFIKHTQSEKIEAVTPAENAVANVTRRTGKVKLDTLAKTTKTASAGCEHPDCGCAAPCPSYLG